MRKLVVTLILFVGALGAIALFTSTPAHAKPTCATVRCLPCPDGYHLSLQWPDCCRCVRD